MTLTLVRTAAVLALACRASSFSPNYNSHSIHISSPSLLATTTATSSSRLFSLIKGEAYGSEPFDENEGGVGLAKRCAVKIVGGREGRKNGSSSTSIEAQELYRYERLTPLDESAIAKSIAGGTYDIELLCSGMGKELYMDPGSSYRVEDKVIKLAPIEAAKDALSVLVTPAASTKSSVVINFLGGDELIIGEVLMACDVLVEGLNLPSATKVKFNSISFADVPPDECYVTVVSVGGGGESSSISSPEGAIIDESVKKGELYIRDGKWFTVTRRDMITN